MENYVKLFNVNFLCHYNALIEGQESDSVVKHID